MSRRFLSVLVLFSFLASAPFVFSQQKMLTILHTNDTHSCLFPFGPQDSLGGIARMSTLIKRLQGNAEYALTLHSGDAFVGTFEFNKYLGYPELKIMEGLYDAMELGNHEFDLGVDTLAGILSGIIPGKSPVELPVLCANIDLASAGLASLVEPYLVKDVGEETGEPIKVGIFGVVNTMPQNYSDFVLGLLTDPIQAAKDQVEDLQALGCQVIICVSHLGQAADTSTDAVTGLASVEGIDIIVGGHSHDDLATPVFVGEKIIVQAGDYGRFLGELKVEVNDAGGVEFSSYSLHRVDRMVRKDPLVIHALNRLRVGLVQDPRFGPVLTKNVAKADWDMEKSFPADQPTFRDTAVGNLVSDAIRWGLGNVNIDADVALEALGYIGSKIYKGKIVGNDVMRVVPYGYDEMSGLGFKIVVVELTGEQLWGGLEYSLLGVPDNYDTAMQPSGLSFQYDSQADPWGRLLWVKINDTLIDPAATYKVAINEQVYSVLNDFFVATFGEPLPMTDTGLFEYNLVRGYMKKLIHVRYVAEGRVIDSPII